jgi:hypothetical protein
MTRTERPMAIPATIDSQGKPGTAGTMSGVVALDDDTESVLKEVEVTVLTEVAVLIDVVTEVTVCGELVDVELLVADVELLVAELVVEDVLLLTIVVDVVTTVVVVEPPPPPPLGGSRWNIRPSEPDPPEVPTAKPSVPETKYRPCNRPVVGKAGIVGTVLQTFPS